jgi:hypothetical protein
MTSTGALPAAVPPSAGTPHPVPPPRRADEAADPVFTVNADALVLPAAIRAGHQLDGPRFADDVWDIRGFLPRTAKMTRIDFTTIADPCHARTIREYLHSRINRGVAVNQLSGTARPMKITSLYQEFAEVRLILRDLAAAGAARLADVTPRQLEEVLAGWKRRPDTAAGKAGVVKYLAAHGPFLTDRLGFTPWPGRPANQIAGRRIPRENTTPRIPEEVMAPLLKAAVFYVQTAAGDLLAAHQEISTLHAACAQAILRPGEARARLEAFIAGRARTGRGIPAAPHAGKVAGAVTAGGIVQAPNRALISLLAGIPGGLWYHHARLVAAGAELGYEQGGLNTVMSPWPGSGQPWRPRLDTDSLRAEVFHLRTACWIVIAYLSGMRDTEVRELARDCAFTEPGPDGRTRYKLRGRVFKDRCLGGDQEEWVVLDVVHQAVDVLLAINDDATHLFGYSGVRKDGMNANMLTRLNRFAAHVNDLLTSPGGEAFIPGHGDGQAPWELTTRQFRRSLAWHIAHQPFGVVAGARQYKHAQVTIFEGYAGTSASGFAAEVEAEQAVARLDYAEDLYRDWLAGAPSGGGADHKINAEFARIHAELADLPGTIADPRRLRTMLSHLAVTLHPGVLGDCFYQPGTALCAKRAALPGHKKPLPMLNTCLTCPNARRSGVHLPRLEQARDQARQIIADSRGPLPPLQQAALASHLGQLDQLISQITSTDPETAQP